MALAIRAFPETGPRTARWCQSNINTMRSGSVAILMHPLARPWTFRPPAICSSVLSAVGKWHLQRGWFIETSVMPGAYAESVKLNDLGSTFEIRSAIAVGKEFATGKSLSLALTHKSNASTADINPGVNSLLLRWHVPFNG
ncbi:acyloxyacyl hydrolase [Phaeobacter sp. BS34]